MIWAWWGCYGSAKRLRKSKQAFACHSHIRFWTVSAFVFSLDWDRIHSSEKEKQQNPKSWVQVVCVLFLAVSGMLLFASCQNGRPNIILQVFPCLGLWSGAVHVLQHGSKGTDIGVLPTCLIFGMVFGWQMFLILWEEAPQECFECFWLGTRRGLHLSNAVMDDSCCNAALLVISLLGEDCDWACGALQSKMEGLISIEGSSSNAKQLSAQLILCP